MVLFETPALNQLLPSPPTADALQEIGNQVYLADQQQGIFVFDQYASLIATWKELPEKGFYAVEDRQYYLNEQNLRIRNSKSLVEMTLALPKELDAKSRFRLTEQRLLIWDERLVRVYRIP